ncbi:MAG: hypothetical protein HZB25_02265 [Candidatus Eisenbacteria bacterium]|nr:hypothetical protein [Candidatus Eisenbacteria bacterium]
MKKILGLTLALALCIAGVALACDQAAKSAAAGSCSKDMKASAASTGACPHAKGMKATAASAEGCASAHGAAAASAEGCAGMKSAAMKGDASCAAKGSKASATNADASCAKGMKATAASAGGSCCAKGAKNTSAAACAKMQHSSFSVAGLTDEAAAAKVSSLLAGMDAVKMSHCDAKAGTATVCWNGDKNCDVVSKKLTEAGFKTAVLKADADCPSSAECPMPCKKGDKASKAS